MSRRATAAGFSYVEVIVAMALITTCLVPALQALQTAPMAATTLTAVAGTGLTVRSKLETVLARPYAVLDFAANGAASSATVPVSSPRSAANPGLDPGPGYSDANFQVYIYRFTGSAISVSDTGLLRIHVVNLSNAKQVADAVVTR